MTKQDKYSDFLRKYRKLKTAYNKLHKRQQSKKQFSKRVCIFGLMLVTAAWLANFILLWFRKEPMSDVTIAIITMFGGFSTGGYFALCGVRDCSKNKHGINQGE